MQALEAGLPLRRTIGASLGKFSGGLLINKLFDESNHAITVGAVGFLG